jgi:xanthine dehydrogenase accessory factor
MELNQTGARCGGLRGLLDALWQIHSRDASAVLGIVIDTDGSTYQKPGALVLLDADGLRHGVISGGCLEPALERAAADVHARGRAATVDFDTRSDEDLLFGSGIGCRGRVRLLLLPLPPSAPLARALFTALDQGVALELALAIDAPCIGAGTATFAAESTMSHCVFCWDTRGHACAVPPTATLRVQVTPPPRLLLLGAGPETPPLATFARQLGWFVTVVEHRARWSLFTQAAPLDCLLDLAPVAAAAHLATHAFEAIIVMSHNYSIDLQYLAFCAGSQARYIGLLGPGARRQALLDELGSAQAERLLWRLHAPVGLNLGGHGAEAIALAIAAQLQQHFAAQAGDARAPRSIAPDAR